jgi:hypothetical protein
MGRRKDGPGRQPGTAVEPYHSVSAHPDRDSGFVDVGKKNALARIVAHDGVMTILLGIWAHSFKTKNIVWHGRGARQRRTPVSACAQCSLPPLPPCTLPSSLSPARLCCRSEPHWLAAPTSWCEDS